MVEKKKKEDVMGGGHLETRGGTKKKQKEGRRKGSSTDAKVFQFSALKHEPTAQLGRPGRLLNKTFIIENTPLLVSFQEPGGKKMLNKVHFFINFQPEAILSAAHGTTEGVCVFVRLCMQIFFATR